ncbi:MAG: TatD family hydrolase [Chitinophagaceae bacterium]|nr:TatD family hydrolase [Chitinophagaceae bacterium]
MKLIDTHCHLYLPEFDADRDAMMQRAMHTGVDGFFLPNVESGTIERMLDLRATYREKCFPMMGLHPCSVKEDWKEELKIIEDYLFRKPELQFRGIGETGLDFYWDKTFMPQQKENFQLHIDWAKELELPIIIHSRDATDACIEMIRENKSEKLSGIFHCFSGDLNQAQQIIELGFYLGIGGVVTFKNGGLDKVLEQLDLSHLVLETDAPYLAPVPHRGKRNESSYLPLIAEKIGIIKNLSTEEVASITTSNAKQVFAY